MATERKRCLDAPRQATEKQRWPLGAWRQEKTLSEALQWVTLGLVVVFVSLEIRHFFHRDDLDESSFRLAELGAYAVAWLLLALGASWAARRWPLRCLHLGGLGLLDVTVVLGTLILGLAANPLWNHEPVGATPVFNLLLWAYGVPAVLLLLLGRVLAAGGSRGHSLVAGIASLLTTFLLVTLEVRQAFHGHYLDRGGTSSGENYAYSLAWILLGTLLVIAGIAARSRMLRYASLAVMLPAIFKVFLYDTRELDELYRVFSFLALGVSLMLLAYLYRRFVFREDETSDRREMS